MDRGEKRGSFLLELPGLLLAALVVAVLIKIFLVQPFYIPSESMVPTLLVDDRVMVSKLNYRFGEPQRGDVVVFENGVDTDESLPEAVVRAVLEALGIRTSGAEDLIKRVVAVAGDEVEIRDNRLLVNDVVAAEPYLADHVDMPNLAPQTVPSGHVWVMGDNRDESSDSRTFGPVPIDSIVGEAVFRIWPLDRLGAL